jgi:hypothetical protein
MRRSARLIAGTLAFVGSACFAQQLPNAAPPPPPPPPAPTGAAPLPGSPLLPSSTTGLSKVGKDGVSTDIVKSVPCSTAARETDGFTTCIGVPDTSQTSTRRRNR